MSRAELRAAGTVEFAGSYRPLATRAAIAASRGLQATGATVAVAGFALSFTAACIEPTQLPLPRDHGAGGAGAGAANGGGAGGAGGGFEMPPIGVCDVAGTTAACFDGKVELANIGACVLGSRTCEQEGEFLVWSACFGSGQSSPEICGDSIDDDCDGIVNNGCPLACDGVSPVWTDPFGDGSLRLKGTNSAAFGKGTHEHSWVCAEDQAHITICDDTTLVLKGGAPTIIAGAGIGPTTSKVVTIEILTDSSDPIWLRPDTQFGPIQFDVVTPNAPITIVHTGAHPIYLCGKPGDVSVFHHASDVFGIGMLPGGVCKHEPNGAIVGTGIFTVEALDVLPLPPGGCP
ncbi:MAG: hypothetical protein EXR75_07250 [Myxococcales bacterium]|nr:hypothetical protein [Myxococcales bacterium]